MKKAAVIIMKNITDRFLDYIFDKFGTRKTEKSYIGHGDFTEHRYWELNICKYKFIRDYDRA
jgi:hypothetical protein